MISLLPLVVGLCPPFLESSIDAPTYAVQSDEVWAVVRSDLPVVSVPRPASAQGSPGEIGAWEPPRQWPAVAIHAATLPTGEIIHYSYPDGGRESRAIVWDPAHGLAERGFSVVNWGENLFCSGLSHLADGSLIVTGGTGEGCDFVGLRETNLYDPFARAWTRVGDLNVGRWYPANLVQPDGRVLVFSGLDETCEGTPFLEMYTPGAGMQIVPNGFGYLPLYPRLHLLTSGRVAFVGPDPNTYTYSFDEGWRFVTTSNHGGRWEGTSVLLPGRRDQVMIVGGYRNDIPTNSAEVIDFGSPQPRWRFTGSMQTARAHADAVILPDKTVFVVGGGQFGTYDAPVNTPEIYDPETEAWTEAAPHFFGRMYHATSLLLADGRVLVAGQDSGQGGRTAEIYRPPYLYRGPRPVIDDPPALAPYGRWFRVGTPEAGAIASVVLIKLSAVTHSVNHDQRLIDLSFVADGDGAVIARGPAQPTEAPPGYYMLFVVDDDGVPSKASIVQVRPAVPGDVDADGDVDFADVQRVLAAWGPCPADGACPADLNDDGEVSLPDLLLVLANWPNGA